MIRRTRVLKSLVAFCVHRSISLLAVWTAVKLLNVIFTLGTVQHTLLNVLWLPGILGMLFFCRNAGILSFHSYYCGYSGFGAMSFITFSALAVSSTSPILYGRVLSETQFRESFKHVFGV